MGDKMIAYIKGTVKNIEIDSIIVEAYGIGYQVNFTQVSDVKLNDDVLIYIYQHIREDENTLYGFIDKETKMLFVKLISVKGLGPKTAMNILGVISYSALLEAIENGDVARIKSLPGIGAKTASQIVLDLKGKLVESSKEDKNLTSELNDAVDALKSLGYKQNEINSVMKILKEMPQTTTDEYVKVGLQNLIKHRR